MELKDFISNTIQQISLGVKDASEKCKDLDVIINPDIFFGSKGDYFLGNKKDTTHTIVNRRIQILEMEIAVNVTEESGNSAKARIGVSSLGIGGNLENSTAESTKNKIKFSLPICLPTSKVPKEENPEFEDRPFT